MRLVVATRLCSPWRFRRGDIGQPFEEKERRAMRQQLLDLLDIERELVGHRQHHRSCLRRLARRARVATSRRQSLRQAWPDSRHNPSHRDSLPGCTPDFEPPRARHRRCWTWSATPTCPPITTKSPSSQLPRDADLRDHDAMPARAVRCAQSAPDYRSWCLRRSPCRRARRGRSVVPAPISTSSWMITRPSCGILAWPLRLEAKPKPGWPIWAPGRMMTRSPI